MMIDRALLLSSLLLCVPAVSRAAWTIPSPAQTAPPGGAAAAAAAPCTYPDEAGFQTRAHAVLLALQGEDLGKWRRGYFSGGDPGKYLPGAAMAKLILNPDDPEPGRYLNDDRSYKEHYHFAAVNWARLYPIFGAHVLTDETRVKFAKAMAGYNYLQPGGTENHKTMWMTSANVLPAFTGVGTNYKSTDDTLAEAKRQLHAYVKGLYTAGAGEWDSSTYLMFTVNGMLNIYDFSPDPECRLLARAALDLLVSAYALKYTDAVFCGPNQRGFYRTPHASIADQTGFVWWGSHAAGSQTARDYRYALAPITSAWRPNAVITHLARRELAGLPGEQRDSKANYWYGQGLTPQPGATHETVYVAPDFTMGSLWDGHASQHTRFMIAASTPEGAVVFNGGHPRQSDHENRKTGLGVGDGTGRYLQSAQVGPTYLCMALAPDDEEAQYTFFAGPESIAPQQLGDAWVYDIPRADPSSGVTQIRLRSLFAQAEPATTPPGKKGETRPILKFPGRRSGFLCTVGPLPSTELVVDNDTVSYRTPDGRRVQFTFNPDPGDGLHGNRAARVSVDGVPLDLTTWPVYSGPFVKLDGYVLSVSDGKDAFTIDFTGDMPVYR